MGKEKRRKKRGKLVIPFLNVETMGVNGVDTLDPHLFSAETGRFPAVSKRLNALQDHVRNGVRKNLLGSKRKAINIYFAFIL